MFVLPSPLSIPPDSATTSTTSSRTCIHVFINVSSLNHSSHNSFQEIVGHLERQYDDILAEESRIKRNPRFRDNRVHALLYFISPTGHA